jgi:hypothetical protein
MVRARIGRKSTSAGYAALKSASTITLLALISADTRSSRHGVKITAVGLALKRGKSVGFTGDGQRHAEA